MIKEYFLKLNKVLVGITTIALIFIGSPYLIAADDDADVEDEWEETEQKFNSMINAL